MNKHEDIAKMDKLDFSIITPSKNMLAYLKRCSASILDQDCVAVEHIVADAVSTDGTAEWLNTNDGIVKLIQNDVGMYDAVNKGLDIAKGDYIAYLNCDEQYLPGALESVKEVFARCPHVDIVFGDTLLVRSDGSLISYRKGYPLRLSYLLTSFLYVHSSSLFFRRRIFDAGCRFNKEYRANGDWDFIIRMLKKKYKTRHLPQFISVFTMTGNNLGAQPDAARETIEMRAALPARLKILSYPLNAARLVEKTIAGAYLCHFPLEYKVYRSNDKTRDHFTAEYASFRWKY